MYVFALRTKILFIIHQLSYGGAEKILAFLANALSLKDYEVYILTYESNITLQTLNSNIHYIGFKQNSSYLPGLRRIMQVKLVRKFNI